MVALLTGCGPTFYTVHIMPASRVVEQARQAQAAEHAPYEFYFAVAHLKKAREEAAEASYQDATRFAEKAEKFGSKARKLSQRRMREMGR
jgi:ABC-type branched-subunit amino acid transport system ATPase component